MITTIQFKKVLCTSNVIILKKFEKRSKVGYKLLLKNVFVLPSQAMNPLIETNDKLELSITEYQWLLDSI